MKIEWIFPHFSVFDVFVVVVVVVAVDVVFVVVVDVEIRCFCWLRLSTREGCDRGAHLGVANGATRPRRTTHRSIKKRFFIHARWSNVQLRRSHTATWSGTRMTRSQTCVVSTIKYQECRQAGDGIAAVKRRRHCMSNTMTVMRADMYFHKNPGVPERRKHKREREVQSGGIGQLFAHGDGMELDDGLTDTLHGYESQCLEMTGTRRWQSDSVPSELHRQTQITRARLRCAAHGSSCIEDVVLQLSATVKLARDQEDIGQPTASWLHLETSFCVAHDVLCTRRVSS